MAIFLFNFVREFAEPVRSGAKRQTMRRTRKDRRRPVPGDVVKAYTGLRTRRTTLLVEAPVVTCRAFRLDIAERVLVVDGARLTVPECRAFAHADGFPTWSAMLAWFGDRYGVDEVEGFVTAWDWERRAQ